MRHQRYGGLLGSGLPRCDLHPSKGPLKAPGHWILLSQPSGSQSTLVSTLGLGRKWRIKLQNSGHNEAPGIGN